MKKTNTNLLEKNHSPMIIRKYNLFGFPIFISLICDENLDDLDMIINEYISAIDLDKNSIQDMRNLAGGLSEHIIQYFNKIKMGCVEACSVIFYADKMLISSLFGDHMCHKACRDELYYGIQLMTQM